MLLVARKDLCQVLREKRLKAASVKINTQIETDLILKCKSLNARVLSEAEYNIAGCKLEKYRKMVQDKNQDQSQIQQQEIMPDPSNHLNYSTARTPIPTTIMTAENTNQYS